MSEFMDGLKDPDARMRLVLIVGLVAVIAGCVVGSIFMFTGDKGGTPIEAPTEIPFWCRQQQREVTLRTEDVKAAEDAWVQAGNDSENMMHVNPETKRRTLAPMMRCPACRKYYIPEALKPIGAPVQVTSKEGHTCTHCRVNAIDWYRENAGKR